MSTKYGRNFTNFQNISLQGSGAGLGDESKGPGMIEMRPGATQAASTLSISMIGSGTAGSVNSANEHPYFHISNAGLSLGTGWIRLTSVGSSPYGTLSVRSGLTTDRSWTLPGSNGILGVMGTLAVGLESIGANNHYSTNVLISQGTGPSQQTDMTCIFGFSRLSGTATTRGIPVYIGNTPTNSGVNLFFINPSATATAAGTWEMNYICAR